MNALFGREIKAIPVGLGDFLSGLVVGGGPRDRD